MSIVFGTFKGGWALDVVSRQAEKKVQHNYKVGVTIGGCNKKHYPIFVTCPIMLESSVSIVSGTFNDGYVLHVSSRQAEKKTTSQLQSWGNDWWL